MDQTIQCAGRCAAEYMEDCFLLFPPISAEAVPLRLNISYGLITAKKLAPEMEEFWEVSREKLGAE